MRFLNDFRASDTIKSEQLAGDVEVVFAESELIKSNEDEEERKESGYRGLLVSVKSHDSYPTLGKDYDPDVLFNQLADLYYGRDREAWSVQVNDTNFKQSRCFPDSAEVIMFKCRQRFECDQKSLISVVLDSSIRSQWDTKIVDWKLFYGNSDLSYCRLYFNFLSPLSPLLDDRDFYIL